MKLSPTKLGRPSAALSNWQRLNAYRYRLREAKADRDPEHMLRMRRGLNLQAAINTGKAK